jgi:short-subunit dehydrogenase
MHMNTKSMELTVSTGSSLGIGAVYADRLAHRGYELLLVAPHRECIDDLAKKLAADLTNSADWAGQERLPNLYGEKPAAPYSTSTLEGGAQNVKD